MDFNISDILTLPNKILAALTLASGLLLFLPTKLLDKLHIIGFQEKYGFVIGIVFITAFSLWLVNSIYTISKFIKDKKNMKKFLDEAGERLKVLTDYQKAIIYLLYSQENYTHVLPLHDGSISALESNIMIGKTSAQYLVGDFNHAMIPYHLQPWVGDELNKNNELLDDFKACFMDKKYLFFK
ncbi:hypothetical protein HMPREF3116_08610 [Aerococcus sp. HMSC10H05]|nr:hypothetical protein HMPREF3116_08610 [Aerococcus sp. HMSC10H05]